jgi:hypothetical protein
MNKVYIMQKLLFFISILSLSLSCQKTKDCISSAGKEIVVEYDLEEFDTLIVNNVFFVSLVQDSLNTIKISGYEDFVNSTQFEIRDNCLILDNCHRCPFVKPDKNKVSVEIHTNKISRITLNEASEVKCLNTLMHENEIGLIVNSKYNEADLKLNVKTFYYWNTHLNGGKILVSGIGENIKLWNSSLGSVDARAFNCQRAFIWTNSKTDCFINASNSVEAEILNTGNIFYRGDPIVYLKYGENAEGRLIEF